jgi:uncharacterized membrane protein YgcG
MKRLFYLMALFCCFALFAKPALAAEEIIRFHSDIRIQKDSSVLVTENITVQAEGEKIKRGIYRDFPVRYKDDDGRHFRIGFRLLAVSRDGHAEPYHIVNSQNGKRIYIGDKDTFIPHGIHRYQLTYQTHRVISFLGDMDELYWNVTGNDWDFPIREASAALYLPDGASISRHHVYTGYKGSRERSYSAYWDPVSSALSVQASRPLAAREGLTMAAGFPKGLVTQPDVWQQLRLRIAENPLFAATVLYVVLLFCYLFTLWVMIGRDPDGGTIIPEFMPPDNFSPALISYIRNMGLGHSDKREAFSAALINLAVKGVLKIEQSKKNHYKLIKDKGEIPGLPPGEAYIAYRMFRHNNSFTISKKYNSKFVGILEGFADAIAGEYAHTYFLKNSKYVTISFLVSALAIGLMGYHATNDPALAPQSFGLIGATVLLHLMFYYLMKAPTMYGREKMDRIEGFRLYLKTAEKSRLDFLHPPEMTPELFEKYLPYAVVLGVENKWVKYFKKSLPRAEQDSYQPRWYNSSYGDTRPSVAQISSNLSKGLSSTLSHAAQAPSSSGSSGGFSGGGGSSGGGFGGGGGGGW